MASATKKVKIRRAIRKAKLGKRRKSQIRNHGTVAADLPLTKPNANEQAQKKKKTK